MADYFWIGGSGNINDTAKWSLTSGGATAGSLPGSGDDTHFDSNSGSGTVTVNVTSTFKSMDFTGSSLSISGGSITLLGDLTTRGGMGWTTTLTFDTTGTTCNLTCHGIQFNIQDLVIKGNGTFNLQDNTFNVSTGTSGHLTINGGVTFNTNNHTISAWKISIDTSGTTINLGSSTITMQGNTGNTFEILNTGVVFNAGTSLIQWASNNQTPLLTGAGKTFYDITIPHFGTNDKFNITGSNTFNSITVGAGEEVDFAASSTQTITTLNAVGTSGSHIKFRSSIGGTQYSLCVTTWNIAYLDVKDMNASCTTLTDCTGVNSGNNTGVDFCLGRAFLLNML